jgi:DNA-directed RNA polymerase subunit K/omega
MVRRPRHMNAFEFAVVAGLRAGQLQRGCTPRVERCEKHAVTAQQEVAQRKVEREAAEAASPSTRS